MSDITIRKLYEAGAHFGHQTRYWNPKMSPYIYGKRNRIHIIDLDLALPLYKSALRYMESQAAGGAVVLFVGTKRAAAESTQKHAERCGSPYVNHRWFGGTLTNFRTIRQSVRRYIDMDVDYGKNVHKSLDKKRQQKFLREISILRRNFEGIKDMVKLPDLLFVVDIGYENIAVQEAKKLGISIVGVVDTNNPFDGIDYILPGNDDASHAVELYTSAAADAVLRGRKAREMNASKNDGKLAKKETVKAEKPDVPAEAEKPDVPADKPAAAEKKPVQPERESSALNQA